jgi:hypothetical protein
MPGRMRTSVGQLQTCVCQNWSVGGSIGCHSRLHCRQVEQFRESSCPICYLTEQLLENL